MFKPTDKLKFLLFAILIAALHFISLTFFFEPAISSPDAQGYFMQGKLIATQGKTYVEPQSVLRYLGPHWYSRDNEKYFASFPTGFPLIIAAIYKIFGPSASLWINPVLASLSLLLFFLFARTWLSSGWALMAMFLLAINPFYNEHALWGGSHIAVIFFLISSLLVLHKVNMTNSKLLALLSGILIGFIPTIRYAEFIFCPVFVLYALLLFKLKKISFITLLSFGIGMCIPLLAMAIRNQFAFGKFWATGYSVPGTPALFGFNHLINHFVPFIMMLLTTGLTILFPLGIAGFVGLIRNKATKPEGIFFATLVTLITLTYMAYYWQPDRQSMRFLLPTFPLYVLAAAWFLSTVKSQLKTAVLIITLLFVLPWGIPGSLMPLKHLQQQDKILSLVTQFVNKNVGESILITNEGICQNLDILPHHKLVDISILCRSDSACSDKVKKPIRNNQAAKIYNNLYGQAFKEQFIRDIKAWNTKGAPVYILAYEKEIQKLKQNFLDGEDIVEVNEIVLPAFPELRNRRPPMKNHGQGNQKDSTMLPAQNRIFDFIIKTEPLKLVKWKID